MAGRENARPRWHKGRDMRFGYPFWFAEIDGTVIAEAVYTSQTGTENYPWDWHLTGEGVTRLHDRRHRKHSGVEDTLRSCKNTVAWLLASDLTEPYVL